MSAAGAPLRARAAGVVEAVLARGRSLKAALVPALEQTADPRDRALLEAMCFEAIRWRRRYQHALEAWMDRPLAPRDAPVQALLLVGLAQLDALRLPAHAAVGSSAEAARVLGRPALVALVNALLRRASREGVPCSEDPAIDTSHPDWLVAALRRDWPEQWPAILAANNRPAPMWLRVNRQRIGREAYLARLATAGIDARLPAGFDAAVVLESGRAPTRLPGWQQGEVSIQDGAAQRAAELLPLRPGARVLDACAAPGGKAAALVEREPDIGLVALDIDRDRLRRVAETFERLRLPPPAALIAADAADAAAWWDGQPFDAILLDAPCTATGVIRRQPDIKCHRRAADVAGLATRQAALLDALWPLLRPGGALLYATCSLLREENEAQIARFLEHTPDAGARPLPDAAGRPLRFGRQSLPEDDDADGFYCALLARRS